MGVEKEGLKSGGGYVGGFFQLFDWTAKSRKRLFSSKPDVQERSRQGNRSAGNSPLTQVHLIDLDECGARQSIKGSSDYSCSSSVTEDEGCGVKVPGVVARLMGLDSLPSSHFSETYFTPSFDTQSLQETHSHRGSFNYRHDCQIMFSGNLVDQADDCVAAPSRKPSEPKPHKTVTRPIEKFQTEILPPKSAKSIPITHHKLLSPIKSPAFIPSKNAAHIMEAAAKIIDPRPSATTKSKMSLIGSPSAPLKLQAPKEKIDIPQKLLPVRSSSVSLKVKELKEKAETSHRSSRFLETSRKPTESNASRLLKGQSMNKSWDGSQDASSFKVLPDVENGSKNKGKSISLAIQAKVNVQRRENVNNDSHRNFTGQKQQTEVKSSQPFKTQASTKKNLHVQSAVCNSSSNQPLKQNNQKQNCHVDRVKLPKNSISNTEGKKPLTGNSSLGHRRNAGRVVVSPKASVRMSGLEISDREKEDLHSNAKILPRKKRSIDRDQRFDKKQATNNMLTDKIQMSVHSNNIVDRKKGTDVVSFTFTAPLSRKVPGSDTSGHNESKFRGPVGPDSLNSSSIECNVIGENALSALLEQKLRELIDKVESPSFGSIVGESESSCLSTSDDISPSLVTLDTMTSKLNERNQHSSVPSKLVDRYNFDCSSTDSSSQGLKHELPLAHGIEECSSNSIDADNGQLLKVRHPSPVSILEQSFSSESCDSSDSNSREGNKFCSSVQGQDVIGICFSKFDPAEAATELLDSASSITNEAPTSNLTGSSISRPTRRHIKWELEYITDILCNVELMFNDYVLGRSHEVINPYLFNILENQNKGSGRSRGESSRVRRKALFDCVCKCLDLRCRQYVGGGFKMWEKGVGVLRRKEQLAKEIWKEISDWKGMGDCMVDELIDKDMSCWHGRWLDFEVDAFATGIEVETQILNSLVEEVLADISWLIQFLLKASQANQYIPGILLRL